MPFAYSFRVPGLRWAISMFDGAVFSTAPDGIAARPTYDINSKCFTPKMQPVINSLQQAETFSSQLLPPERTGGLTSLHLHKIPLEQFGFP